MNFYIFVLDGMDYIGLSETLEIVEGQSRACVNIEIIADGVLESLELERFNVSLTSSDPTACLPPPAAVFINDTTSKLDPFQEDRLVGYA